MPYQTEWVDPELFLEHEGVKVFHAYKENEADEALQYWYAVEDDDDPDGIQFDVRNFDGWDHDRENHAELIRNAIDRGGKQALLDAAAEG